MPGSVEPNRRLGLAPVVKITMTMAELGLCIATLSSGVSYLVTTQRPIDLNALYTWGDIILWIWPSSIMTMAPTTHTSSSLAILGISIIANGYVYGFLGLIAGSIRQKYLEDTNRWPRSLIWGYMRRNVKWALLSGGLISVAVNLATAPWYIPAMKRVGAAAGPSLIVHNIVLFWIELTLLIFLPLFLRSGFRESAASRASY